MDCSEITSATVTQAITVCVTSSFSWWHLLTPVVITFSAIAAWRSISASRETARKRATIDLIEKVESTPHYRELHKVFSYHRRTNGFDRLHNPTEEKDKDERQSILDYLNHYELVSIGIQQDILDADSYKGWMLGPFIRDWNAASSFIQRERWKWDNTANDWEYHAQLFENYQTVVCEWSNEAICLTKEHSGPPNTPEGPGDEALPDGTQKTS